MTTSTNDFSHRHEEYYEPSAGPAITIPYILLTLRREWWFPTLGCLIGLILAVCYIDVAAQPVYKSSARILVDRSMKRYLQTNKISDEPTFDQAEMESQIHIITSESIIVPVVRALKLTYDSEFVGPPNALGAQVLWSVSRKIDSLKSRIIHSFKQYGSRNGANTLDPDAILERTAVEAFLKNLTVYREETANVISVTFASQDANKAAEIANAVADAYITMSLEAKSKSTRMASQWLQDRLTELRAQAMEADRALQNYKIANNLVYPGKGPPNSEQLSTLSTQLANARTVMADAKARFDRIQEIAREGIPGATFIDALNNSTILKLRSQYMDLAAKATEIESHVGHVGPSHQAIVKLNERMAELRRSIQEEEQRIAGSYASEYQIAKAREGELAASMAELMGEVGTSNQAQVTMRDLESSADNLRNLYNSFLQKFQEMSTIQTHAIAGEDARIVTRAAPPLHKSGRRALAVLVGGIALGLFLGVGAAIGREWAADVFRNPVDIKQLTGVPCFILPSVRTKVKRSLSSRGGKNTPLIEEFVLDQPFSRFAETLRSVIALIRAAQKTDSAKVLGVVSSVSKEGKTTVAANLAALMVATSGARTLLIDGDLHLRLLTARLAPEARQGLIEALADPSRLGNFVTKRESSGLDVLPCVLSKRIPNAAELLGSFQMERLLATAGESYDCIMIEIPPIMSVADVKMIGHFIDRFIFIVEWGQTKRSLFLEALSEAEVVRERLAGIILNKADPRVLRSIEAYKGKRFKDYYEE